MFNTGDIVNVNGSFERFEDDKTRCWKTIESDEFTKCIVLGWVYVYDGVVKNGGYDWEADLNEPNYFVQTKSHKAYKVQPLEENNRWRKPFLVLEKYMELYFKK